MMAGLPPFEVRAGLAQAVHLAVAEFTASDGFGHCYLYAAAGWRLACEVLEQPYLLQAGSLRILADPPDGWLSMPLHPDGLRQGAYHCWFSRADESGSLAEVVDLSARHHKRWANQNRQPRPNSATPVQWTRPEDPPDFVWSEPPFPTWMGLVADLSLTLAYHDTLRHRKRSLEPLHRLARHQFTLLQA